MNELREALSVAPGDTNWKSHNQVNDIHHALTCCESLVIVAEEERTVHFVHQSVVQFLLDQRSPSKALHFDLAQASLGLGEVCLTYLNYGIFDQDLSTNVVPTIPAGVIPAKITRNTLTGKRSFGQIALMLLNLQSTDGPEIGKIMAETGRFHRQRQEAATFEFLRYASQHWLIHTAKIDPTHSAFSLWEGLLHNSKFDGLVWGPNRTHPDKLLVDEKSGNIWKLAPRVTWAISHSHLPLLLFELRSKRGLKALCSIIPYVRALVRAGDRFEVDAAMALKLFKVAVVGAADDIANLILRTHRASYDGETFLDPFLKHGDLARIGWIISLKYFGTLVGLEAPIVEMACRARNLQILNIALSLGARVDLYGQNPLILLLNEMRDPLDLALACRLLEAGFPLKACEHMEKRLYWFLHYHALVNDHINVDPCRAYSFGSSHDSISGATCQNLVGRACFNGNFQMVQKLLGDQGWGPPLSIRVLISPVTLSLWMTNTLRTYSTERRKIVRFLGKLVDSYPQGIIPTKKSDDWNSMLLDVFRRCLQLRAWELADAIPWRSNLRLPSLRNVIMSCGSDNRQTDGHDANPNVGDATHQGSSAAFEDQGEAEIATDASAQKSLKTYELEATTLRSSNSMSLVHLSASCGDKTGMKFLLDALGSYAHTILSVSSPLDSCFGGDVPFQILLSQEQSTVEECADFLEIGCTFLRLIGDHGSSACGQRSKSCVDLAPRFCAKVVQIMTRQELEVWGPGVDYSCIGESTCVIEGASLGGYIPEFGIHILQTWEVCRSECSRASQPLSSTPGTWLRYFRDKEESARCLALLKDFLKTWIAHLPPSANPKGLLIPMLDAMIRGFGEAKAASESREPGDKVQRILRRHCADYCGLGFVLVQSLGAASFDDMLHLLLSRDPSLEDYIAGFKEAFFDRYNI